MAKVAQETEERAGVDADKLLELLVNNAAAELTAFYCYTILRLDLIGIEDEGIKDIAEVARIEDRNHFEALVSCINEPAGGPQQAQQPCSQLPAPPPDEALLAGELSAGRTVPHDCSACPPASLPTDPKDINAMLTVLVEAERNAIRGYTQICDMTAGRDHRTYDLSLAILNEEIEHESWLSGLLGEDPSGHCMRRRETSPFVGRFLR